MPAGSGAYAVSARGVIGITYNHINILYTVFVPVDSTGALASDAIGLTVLNKMRSPWRARIPALGATEESQERRHAREEETPPGSAAYYPGKKDHHKRVTTERPHPTGGSWPREGHGKGKLIRILFSVYFGGFRG